jgi:hypothetical protein
MMYIHLYTFKLPFLGLYIKLTLYIQRCLGHRAGKFVVFYIFSFVMVLI